MLFQPPGNSIFLLSLKSHVLSHLKSSVEYQSHPGSSFQHVAHTVRHVFVRCREHSSAPASVRSLKPSDVMPRKKIVKIRLNYVPKLIRTCFYNFTKRCKNQLLWQFRYLSANKSEKRWCTFCAMENFCAMWTPRTLTFWNCIVHQIEAISSNFESNCPQLPTCFTISKRVEMLLSLALLTLLEEQSSSFTFKTKRHSHCPSKTNTRLA